MPKNNKKTRQTLPFVDEGRAFTIRGREHEEKCNVAKRFTVDISTERDRIFTESGLWIRLLHLTQKDALPDSK